MTVEKTIIKAGHGVSPKPGDTVTMEYTGFLKDTGCPDNKGKQFDSSVGRGDFEVVIGRKCVIKGWDEAIPTMKVGEKATLDISSDYAYGKNGFGNIIPSNASLIFDVELKKVN
ncbi:Bgt-4035 [Blumeria graminis f. sp. tritici]|uniref:peptidylprolyl isomerase n=3 Tax=Blumeria graminis TaxID=34373 RepID=A0A061HLY5_BLUGR|nr:Peptidyl-prolyl cis-trans isomerase (PPIase) [Blumeria graminis f. sp. tritici 96224]VDB92725.1 Bgt-4035 [Blumeria graminis f. sp. tritici]